MHAEIEIGGRQLTVCFKVVFIKAEACDLVKDLFPLQAQLSGTHYRIKSANLYLLLRFEPPPKLIKKREKKEGNLVSPQNCKT